MNEAPNETWTHSWRFACFACKLLHHPRCPNNLLNLLLRWGIKPYETRSHSWSLLTITSPKVLSVKEVSLSKQYRFIAISLNWTAWSLGLNFLKLGGLLHKYEACQIRWFSGQTLMSMTWASPMAEIHLSLAESLWIYEKLRATIHYFFLFFPPVYKD